MSKVHRRILPASETRCCSNDCHKRESCARFTSPIAQGSPIADFKRMQAGSIYGCLLHISAVVEDSDDKPAKEVKPWPTTP